MAAQPSGGESAAARGSKRLARIRAAASQGPIRTTPLMVAITGMSIVTTSPVFFAGAFGAHIAADLAIGPAALGGLATTFFATTGLSATHLGRLADRLGGSRAGRLAVTASATALLLAGLGTTYWALVVAMAVGGIGNGLGGPTANMVVADRVPRHRMGAAFGIKQSAVPAATLLGGIAVPLSVVVWGWRPTMIGAAVVAFASLLTVPHARGRRVPTRAPGTRKPGLDRVTLATGAAFLFGIAAATAMSTLLSTFVVGQGFSASFAGLALSFGSLGAIVVRIVVGLRADEGRVDGASMSAWMMTIGAGGFLAIATGSQIGIVAGAFLAYAIGWGWSGLLVLNLMRAHPGAPGSATGVVLTGAAIGGMIGPVAVGLIAERAGFPVAWTVAALMSLTAAVAARRSGSYLATRAVETR